jgi:kinesin family protein 13
MTDPISFSSGYGSQAVSSTNLSSEDSMSIRSISVDETPDIESRALIFVEQLQPVSEASGDLVDNEGNATSKSNCKLSLNERINTAVNNETQKKVAAQKPVEILEKGKNLDMTEGSLQIQNTALAEEKQTSNSSAVDRNSLSLELANGHASNLSNINDSSQIEGGDVVESSSEAHAMNETQEPAEDMPQLVSGSQDCAISTTESPTSDTQPEASRRVVCSSKLISPSEETQIPADTDTASVKAVSSPEPTSTSVTNSGDDESPCEGTSVVHTRLPPGKVWYIYELGISR